VANVTAAPEVAPATPRPSMGRRLRGSATANLASLVGSLATYVALTRLVDPAEYGQATLVIATWGLCQVSTDWCGESLMRFGPVELSRAGTLRTTLSTRLVFAVAALALLLPGAPLYFHFVRGWPPLLLALTDVYLVAGAAVGIAHWAAVAAQRFRPMTVTNFILRGTPLIAILLLHAVGRAVTARVLILAAVVANAAGALVLLGALRPLLGLTRPDRQLLAAMWRYSRPMLWAAPCIAITTFVDPIILRHSVSYTEVGRYQFAYLTITLFGMAGASFNGVFSPELVSAQARHDTHTVDHYRRRLQPELALALGLAACAGACVAAPLTAALLPARWAGAGELIALLSVAGGLLLATWTFYPLVTSTDNTPVSQLAIVCGAATNLTLDLVLAPRFGTAGVALANVAAWSAQLLLVGCGLHRRIGARRRALLLIPVALPTGALLAAGVSLPVRVTLGALLLAAAVRAAQRARVKAAPAS
jgi:O-antigen/teichoic acid export membrane protein